FTGVGKTLADLGQAIDLGIRTINVESAGEIARVDALSRERQTRTKIAIRINPDVDAKTHPHISTGLKTNKFGVPIGDVPALCAHARALAGVEIVGLHAHIGSQITDLDPLTRAARALVALARELAGAGTRIEHLDLGGGLGVSYDGSRVPTAREYADAVLPIVRESGLAIVLEPGRQIVAPAGALLTRVVDVKEAGGRLAGRRLGEGGGAEVGGERLFVVMDAGMTELIRPMLYNAFHRIEPVVLTEAPPTSCDVVGPLCESSDTLGKDRTLPRPQAGELYAILDTGAYGSVMASNYNRRLLPAEVMVEDGKARVIRRRQTIDELLSLEL
ncbi:MAG TPA: diaminopimelate decarboxylase, partial [Vicinamibacterales bacterium]